MQILLLVTLVCGGIVLTLILGFVRLNGESLRAALPFLPMWLSPTWVAVVLFTGIPLTALAMLRLMLWLIEDQRYRLLDLGQIDRMDGLQFEYYVARLMQNLGYSTQVTPATNDYGVDVVAERGGSRFAVQVKRYQGKVSRRAVSDAVGGMKHYNCNRCMVVTNSYFTEDASRLANENSCTLVDRNQLSQWVAGYKTGDNTAWALHKLFVLGPWFINLFVLFGTLATLYNIGALLWPHASVMGVTLPVNRATIFEARPAATPVPTLSLAALPPAAAIERVWIEPNITENNVRGLRVHVRFNIANAKGQPHLLALTFSDANHQTHLSTGIIERSFQPDNNPQLYADSLVFVPLDQIAASLSKNQAKYTGFVKAQILQSADRRVLTQSGEVVVSGQ